MNVSVGTTIFLLYFDTDTSSREEWNFNYTPVEVYLTEELRQKRVDFLQTQTDDVGNFFVIITRDVLVSDNPTKPLYADEEPGAPVIAVAGKSASIADILKDHLGSNPILGLTTPFGVE